ncbi:MAG: GAF domain-containing protein, partial [Alphaproteobacteria bacterium]|nr:GAF domain-containing protein [Alphaproteobacteria bacterium]
MSRLTNNDKVGGAGADAGYRKLIEMGIALSAERNHKRLLELILLNAKDMTNADGGTLYLLDGKALKFAILRNDSLKIAMGGTTGIDIPFPPVRLEDDEGRQNHNNVSAHVALTGKLVNIADAYDAAEFDFSGTRKFDAGTGYRSKSFLTVPLKNHQDEVIGVLQLINARTPSGEVAGFLPDIVPLIEALSSQAAVALDNRNLIEAQKRLLESFIKLIAKAIDAKSPYTGGHCERVPELTKMLAQAACQSDDPRFAQFQLSEDEWEELHIASWLHDCGKVTTPEYVVDKATKLETIYDRIHEVRMRFEVLKRDAEIECWKSIAQGADSDAAQAALAARLAELDQDYAFVAECNVGGEFMAPDKIERLKKIAATRWLRTLDDRLGVSHEEKLRQEREPAQPLPAWEDLLADKPEHVIFRDGKDEFPAEFGFDMKVPANKYNRGELYNLCVARGTLTEEDRFKINEHIVQTIIMLKQLPFPKHLKAVPEIAGGHHEKMDGNGYPKRLKRDQMSLPARMMAIADIFEALTAVDRPYKKGKTLSETVKIMSFMKKDQHIDPDLFELFLTSGVYNDYAKRYMKDYQIDPVDVA